MLAKSSSPVAAARAAYQAKRLAAVNAAYAVSQTGPAVFAAVLSPLSPLLGTQWRAAPIYMA
jgi:hypothetical protein